MKRRGRRDTFDAVENPGANDYSQPLYTSAGRQIAAVAVVAVAVRFIYLYEYHDHPFFTYFFLDPLWHHQWASEIASGKISGSEVFFRAPLYPYFLGLIYSLFEPGFVASRTAQFLMGACGAVMVYLLGRRLLKSDLAAMIAGLAFTLYGPMIYFEGELLIVPLIVFLDLLGLLILYRALDKSKVYHFALAGFIFGASAIARPNVLAPAIIIALWLAVSGKEAFKRKLAGRAAPFLAALFILPLAVTARNGVVAGDYVFIAGQGGVNFYIGNNANSDGKTAVAPGLKVSAQDYRDSVWINSVAAAERDMGREMSSSEVSDYWYGRAFDWIQLNPLDASGLYLRKAFYLIHGHEIPSNNVIYFSRTYSSVMKLLVWDNRLAFPAGLLIPLCFLGMVMAWPGRRKWAPMYIFVVFYAGTIVLFFVTSRYRMPVVGPAILFALFGATWAFDILRRRQWKKGAPALAAMVALLTLSNTSAFGVRKDDMTLPPANMGNYYFENSEYEKAAEYYRKTLEHKPDHFMSLSNLGSIAFMNGEIKKAGEYYRKALEAQPAHPVIHNNLGLVLEKQGKFERAENQYIKALRVDPGYRNAKGNLARVRKKLNPKRK